MSTTTTNYGLIKPDTSDPILIGQLNDNSDAIDAALKENADAIENKPDAADIPSPSTAAPAMDGTAAAGTSTDYARADHVHPSDTSKQDTLTTVQLAAANSGINSTKVEQIETNKNNILLVEEMNGAKNIVDYAKADLSLFPSISTGATISLSGDEWTINGTTNATGTLIPNIYFAGETTKIIPNGEYVAQIFPTIENVQLQIVTNNIITNGNRPITFTVTDDDTRSWARLYLANNKTFNSAKIKLMIMPKSLWDAGFTDYQPYAMSNAELTAAIQAIQAQLANQ